MKEQREEDWRRRKELYNEEKNEEDGGMTSKHNYLYCQDACISYHCVCEHITYILNFSMDTQGGDDGDRGACARISCGRRAACVAFAMRACVCANPRGSF